jgi:hypothetical protein
MTMGVQQLFQHITLWSRIPPALTALDPWTASTLAGNSREALTSLNHYVRDMRLQEINLLKALRVDPDRLSDHLAKNAHFSDFFQQMSPRPEWMEAHPNLSMAIDDMNQMRRAIAGTKRRLNHLGVLLPDLSPPDRLPNQPGLEEHLQWLREMASVRSELAKEAVSAGEQDASEGIRQFYDDGIRSARRVITLAESLKVYIQIPVRPKLRLG